MDIPLRCSECNEKFTISSDTLCGIWKNTYIKLTERQQKQVKLTAEGKCPCGNVQKYDGFMFRYLFKIIFDEFANK